MTPQERLENDIKKFEPNLKSFNTLTLNEQEKILVKARLSKLKELDKIDKHLATIRGGNKKES
jgi:hypothetical protein